MISSFFSDCHSLLKARLSRTISFWVFLSIVLIEIIIFIPSYYREQKDLLSQLEDLSMAKINAIVLLTQQEMSEEHLKTRMDTIIKESDVIAGLSLYDSTGKLLKTSGNAPSVTLEDLPNSTMVYRHKTWHRRWYHVAWPSNFLGIDYTIIVRHDAASVRTEMYRFIVRITGLVIIIGMFVTFMTMIILSKMVINPILRLRDDLNTAGEALSQDQLHCNFYSLKYQTKNELGDVMETFVQMFERVATEIAKRKEADQKIRLEQQKSEALLLNILPAAIAESLKQGQNNIAQGFQAVTILFADIVHFTEISAQISPKELVRLLNQVFSAFDELTDFYGLEKIKTIGDNYMVAGGLPQPRSDHAFAVANMALDMLNVIQNIHCKNGEPLQIRIGINTGSVVAGVIGTKKFIYDLWGDAVNVASRMESQGMAGKIQVTEATYHQLKEDYLFEERGTVFVKGKGEMKTYFLLGKVES